MNKVKLELIAPAKVSFDYNGVTIEVEPFLSTVKQVALINKYIEDFFGKIENPLVSGTSYNRLEAEFNLINYILQSNTNIDAENLPNDFYSDTDLVDRIVSCISNYADFRFKLDDTVMDIKEQIEIKNSLGQTLTDIIDNINVILDKMSDISPEDLQKAQEAGKELIKDLEASSIVGKPVKKTRKRSA